MKTTHRRDEFVLELVSLHAEAHRVGLHRTGRALHEAVRAAGWELAAMIEKAARAKRNKKA